MGRTATLLLCALVGALFAWVVPLERLLAASTAITVPLSVVAAALLVRLNRTMPTLEWKSIDREPRERLTAQIVNLSREYLVVLALVACFLLVMVALVVVGDATIFGAVEPITGLRLTAGWPESMHRSLSGLIGLTGTLVLVRTGYVVWRDYDIVRLQKAVIDAATAAAEAKAHKEEQERLAEEKRASMTKAGLRSVNQAAPRPWKDAEG